MNYDNNNNKLDNSADDDWLTGDEAIDYVAGTNVPGSSHNSGNLSSDDNSDPYGDYDPSRDRSLTRSSAPSSSPLNHYSNYTEANVAMGTLGAVLGGAVGGYIWYLLADNRFLNMLVGTILVYLVIQGYKLLGKKLDRNGIWICSILIVVIAPIAHVLCWTHRMQSEITTGAYIGSLFIDDQAIASAAIKAVTEKYDFSYCLSHIFDYVNDGFFNLFNFYGVLVVAAISVVATAKYLYKS